MNYRDDFREANAVARAGSWRIAIWIIVTVLFIGALSWAVWAVSVGASDIRGKGNAIKQKNSADNRIAAQERFEQLYAEVVASDRKLEPLAAAAKTGGPTEKQAYTGAQTYCLSVVADYDANARKYTQAQFRAADLPYQIDTTDPSTDCKAAA